jgi:hypothetical protein
MGKRGKSRGRVGKAKGRTRPYPYEFRIKMVRLYLEEGYSTTVLREQFGVSGGGPQKLDNVISSESEQKERI